MLIRITEKCSMGCNHCLSDAYPEGKHMEMSMFRSAVGFSMYYDQFFVLITGGEPTEHPDFLEILEFLQFIKKNILGVAILSNGSFLYDEKYTVDILKYNIPLQITNDPRFYPKEIPIVNHPLLIYENHIRTVSPFGRALKSNLEFTRQSPFCFNMRSIAMHYGNFKKIISDLRGFQKFCSPSININGDVVAGEAPSCYKIGTIASSEEELIEAIDNMQCNKCGLGNQLTGSYQAVWEYMEAP